MSLSLSVRGFDELVNAVSIMAIEFRGLRTDISNRSNEFMDALQTLTQAVADNATAQKDVAAALKKLADENAAGVPADQVSALAATLETQAQSTEALAQSILNPTPTVPAEPPPPPAPAA